jgi:hypothetical protein
VNVVVGALARATVLRLSPSCALCKGRSLSVSSCDIPAKYARSMSSCRRSSAISRSKFLCWLAMSCILLLSDLVNR